MEQGYRQSLGRKGEIIAADYMKSKGFEVISRNYRGAGGEIDFIARSESIVVFVEVKSWRSKRFGAAELRVTKRKQKQLYKVANHFIENNGQVDDDYRIDIIAVYDGQPNPLIRHLPNAFFLMDSGK